MNLLSQPTHESSSDTRRALLAQQLRTAAEEAEALPLSFAQQRLWVLDQLEPNSALYNVPLVLAMSGVLDTRALQQAIDALVARHEVLRTRFVCRDENPVQLIEETIATGIVHHDLTGTEPALREAAARSLLEADVNRPFDLSTGPLLRATLLRLAEHEHWFILNLHHIIADEWSLKNCFRELTALYEAFHAGKQPALPELQIQYADYAVWQRNWLKNGVVEHQLAYWRHQLRGNPPVLELPTDRARPALPTFSGAQLSRALPLELSAPLTDLAARHGASPFMVLLAAFKALLHRYTHQSDILVGSPVAGRNRLETEELIGFFVNTLVLRTDLSGNPSFEELLQRVRETTLGAHAHQELPFEKLVEELCPERTLDHMPFTRIMFAVQNSGLEAMRWPELTLRFLEARSDTAKFDLTFVVRETTRGMIAQIEFNRDLFQADSIRRMLEHFEVLLAAAVEHPKWTLAELPLLGWLERRKVLVDWNCTATPFPRDKTVTQIFEEQVERAPDAIAVVFGNESVSWQDLNVRANQLASHLKKFSVGPNVSVALCLERSVDMVVAMLAVLKAGGTYVPLDPGYPKPRLEFMLEDSRAPVLLTQQKLLGDLPRNAARVVCLDSDWELIGREGRTNLSNAAQADNLAYIIYTSGSTGQPKGVAVPHRAIVRLVQDTNYIRISPEDRIAQASNAAFDAATFEIWGALLNGAQLVGVSKDVALSPADFAAELRERKISILFLTTALFNQVAAEKPDAFATARVVMFGGEAVDPKWVRAVLKHRPQHLLHVYGPTENTTFSTWQEIIDVPDDAKTIPIGQPISNTECFVLDSALNPVPIGVPGELHLAGDGLARGYWNQPELTAQKFIRNPFHDANGSEWLYRTGDLVRWLPDGTIEFIGRADQQVKIRGFRIELGEIESTLQRHPGVRECAVAVYADTTDKKLVAYFVPNRQSGPGISDLRNFLKDKLPDYMVPASFIRLDALPLTPNGKVDRDALPEPDKSRPDLDKRYASPQDAVEVELTRIWENVLGIQPVGIQDKFFELGGHSLLAVRVIAQVEKAFGRKLRLATIFQAQTIEQLAAILRKEIQEDSALSGTSLVEIQPKGSRPPIFFVHGAGGGMFWGYVNLSRHLGADQPVYGIRSCEPDSIQPGETIEQMATRYIADIRALQPKGPYHLGGYCFGGNLAFEMARQLREQGEEIATLALFNCAPANSRYSRTIPSPQWVLRFLVNLCYWGKYFWNWTPPQRREFFRWKKGMLKRRASRLLGQSSESKATVDPGELVDLSSYSAEQRKLWESHIRALIHYHPQPFPGRVHLFRSPGHPLLCSFDADYGWGDLAQGGVEITIVPGVHEKILEEPCVSTLAAGLKQVLNETGQTELKPPSAARDGLSSHESATPATLERGYAAHFEEQVARTPEAVALRFENQELTYAELNRRSNRLARHLQARGVGPETLVAVCLDRSIDLPIALLAIFKAGGAYLPLDRSYPAERLSYMLEDSQARVLVSDSRFIAGLDGGQREIICLDDSSQREAIGRQSDDNLPGAASSENLAYVIYTSGSTGQPKGVEITHRGLLNHSVACARVFHLTTEDRVLQFSPISFDISVEEFFPAWLAGCAVVMRTDDVISSTARFADFVASERISILDLPTAYWHELVEYVQAHALPKSVRLVVIGGEKASEEAWRRWRARVPAAVTLINTYGPTEATVTATLHVAKPGEQTLPIGRPLDNVQLLVLDNTGQPVRDGEPGELHIGGPGVARGYRRRPELTAEKFIASPLAGSDAQRWYKTGDLVRYVADGELEFVGRTDDQVKIRGYRIELGEIEAALRTHPGLKEGVVVARDDGHGKRLLAYFVSREGAAPGVSELRNHLKATLPAFMIPAFFIPIECLPLTPAGKVDRHSLPPPDDTRPDLDQAFEAPRTPVEEVIAGIWCDVLGLDRAGIHDNFFDLGGHSLLAAQVIARIREALKMEVPLASVFSFPTIATLAERLAEASPQTQPVLPSFAIAKGKRLPLTAAQQRLWFLDQFEPHQSAYNITTACRLEGELNLSALEQSLTDLTLRHEALRAVFPTENGEPVQIICEPKPVKLATLDLSGAPEKDRDAQARRVLEQEAARSYVMSSPTLRPFLIRISATEHLFLLMTHRIACDSESVGILLKELTTLYASHASGHPASLPPIPLSYPDAAARPVLPGEQECEQLQFWKKQLQGAPALLELPADWPRPAHQSDLGARIPLHLSREITDALDELRQKAGCGMFEVLLAAFQTLLSRYTGARDIVVGSTVSTRRLRRLPDLAGKFDNLIVLRSNLSADPAFTDFLGHVRQTVALAQAHSGLPFERVLDELRPERNASYTPVCQVMFDYSEDTPQASETGGLRWTPIFIDNRTAKVDLQLYLANSGEGLTGWIEYSAALFNADRISRMAGHFTTLVKSIVEQPQEALSRLQILPGPESHRMLVEWNATEKAYRATATLAELFEEQVQRSPDAIALIAGIDRLSYQELNARANQLAHHLRSVGVRPGVLVGICLERSWRLLVGILGVLKAGGAYVPLDPAYPRERLTFILQDAQAPVLLTQESLRGLHPAGTSQVICLDSDWQRVHAESRGNPERTATGADLAYVIYTSGSTGQPKGVAIEHRAAVALVSWAKDVFSKEEIAGVLASTSVCFDLSIFEMFVPLSWGGTVILAENALAMPTLPAVHEVSLINTVPSAMRELLRVKGVPPGVRVINLAGEPLLTPLVNQIYAATNAAKVYDLYGPSETTTYSTYTLRQPDQPATIGRPLANEQVYLLDANRQPVPIGVPGELYIGGDKLARGYLNRPELTAEKFVSNPFRQGTRLYRTGDLARWRADGNLEFLGRMDHQVKIRGYRIELGEIETALKKHSHVRDAVVLAREDPHGGKRLVAYIVTAEHRPTTDELRGFVKERLPDYMTPAAFVVLDALPLTPNGKIDRKALPEPEQDRSHAANYVPPHTPMEKELAAIWREVLRIERVGIRDNFFELGGHSLLAIQVISRLRESLNVELPLFSLFDAPTIEALARGLQSGEWTRNQVPVLPIQPVSRDANLPVSHVQERLWFLDQLHPGDHAYNVPMAWRLKGTLDVDALQRAFNEVVRRHESLRTTFHYADGNLCSKISPPAPLALNRLDCETLPEDQRDARVEAWFKAEAQAPFNLASGPLIRASLARLGEWHHALLVVMHHTICDGWSLTILFQEIEALYDAFAAGKPAPALPVLPVQYADFACWKRQWLRGTALENELKFWTEHLKGAPARINLPADHKDTKGSREAARQTVQLPQGLTAQIAALSQREHTTPFAVLLAALAVVLEKWTGQQDLVIGTVVAGRNRRELENVIGCFMNFLPIRTRVAEEESGANLLATVTSAVIDAQSHQDCPFEKIVEAVNPARRQDQNPLYNVALLLQNFPTEMFKTTQLQASPMSVEMEAALLDLRFEAEAAAQGMTFTCEYRKALFEPDSIEQLLASFRHVIERLVSQPESAIRGLTVTPGLLAQAQSHRVHQEEETIAIAATFTAEPIEESLRYWLGELEMPANIAFAPYNQVFQELLDPGSSLGANTRGLDVLLVRFEDWVQDHSAAASARQLALERNAREFVSAVRAASIRTAVPFLVLLCPASSAWNSDPECRRMLEDIENFTVAELNKGGGVHVATARELLETYPVADYYDASADELGRVPYTPVFFTALGTLIARRLHALKRAPHKVIVLDCDQTLWSGVCGEDGAKGVCLDAPRRALQEFMRAQLEAGRLLAVCSKNHEEDVRAVFAQRLEMPLRAEHFAAWRINWLPKSENIKSIAQELNLGLDSFVFIDDNPVECAEVEAACPEVLTLQLPESPELIPQFLKHCWVFDHANLTDEDRKRGELYRQNQQREQLRSGSTSLADFLAGLNLQIQIGSMSEDQLPRVSQLTHRTNQFNCTTVRRTEAEIRALAAAKEILCVSVKDRFGDYGLVGVLICSHSGDSLDVDTFLLSCRVLGRGVEHQMLASLGRAALEQKCRWVDVHFHSSDRNQPAENFLQSVGADFRQAQNGGFIYRFPAEVAAQVTFNPQSLPVEPTVSPTGRTSAPRANGSTANAKKFRRCRVIALEATDAAKIHQVIESKTTLRRIVPGRHAAPENETQRQLCDIWQRLLHLEEVGVDDNFFQLGGHSLLAVRLFAEVEKLTGNKLPLVTIFKTPTIRELARALRVQPAADARTPLVPVQPNGSLPPLFLVHGAGGDVLWGYANLAACLSPDQPVYGIKSRGQIGLDEYDSIEEMARYYVQELRVFQPHGPYHIGGYCLGGNIAYEMARQLHALGERVALVALIDAFPSNAGYERVPWWRPRYHVRFAVNLYHWLADFTRQTAEERRRFVSRKARIAGRKLLARLRTGKTSPADVDLEEVIDPGYFPQHELKFWKIHLRALVAHVERPYAGAVTLIRTRGQPLFCSLEEDFCWNSLARGGVTVKHIPGSHENIFIEPNVRFLAQELEASLASVRSAAHSETMKEPLNT